VENGRFCNGRPTPITLFEMALLDDIIEQVIFMSHVFIHYD